MKDIKGWKSSEWFWYGPAASWWFCFDLFVVSWGVPVGLAMLLTGWVWVTILSIAAVAGFTFLPALVFRNPIERMNNQAIHPNGTIHDSHGRGYHDCYQCPGASGGSYTLIKEVLSLPAEDRSPFPYDLADVLMSDLDPKRRYEINMEIHNTLEEIKARNKQRELMSKRAIPTDHILETLKDARQSFKIETDTIKELI